MKFKSQIEIYSFISYIVSKMSPPRPGSVSHVFVFFPCPARAQRWCRSHLSESPVILRLFLIDAHSVITSRVSFLSRSEALTDRSSPDPTRCTLGSRCGHQCENVCVCVYLHVKAAVVTGVKHSVWCCDRKIIKDGVV